jgi:hypothetical protein
MKNYTIRSITIKFRAADISFGSNQPLALFAKRRLGIRLPDMQI